MSSASTSSSTSSIDRIVVPLAIAGLIFFIFPVLSEAYELQLREFSAWMAEICLRITNLDVSRSGTILSLPGMTFDIIPACSGSEMLRTLIFVGILWGGIHPHISPINKVVATLLAAIIALLANGLRLTILLGFSYMRGSVIEEGLLHDLIGLTAFAIALPGFFVITELLAKRTEHDSTDSSPSSNMLAFTVVLSAMAYLPVVSACVTAWMGTVYNQFDRFGYIFFFIGVAGWVTCWKLTTADHERMRLGSIIFAISSGLALLSQIPGPNLYVLGVTLMVAVFSIGLAYRNFHYAIRCVPFQLIMFLSYPKVSESINLILGTDGVAIPLVIKSLATLVGLTFFFFVCLPIKRPFIPLQPVARWSAFMTISAACMLIGMLYMVRTDFRAGAITYSLPYLLGEYAEWEGSDIADAEGEDFYQRSNVLNRQYVRGNERVGVMIVPSDGNRKTIHTPEYCQMGLGWEPVGSKTVEFNHEKGIPAKARKLQLKNQKYGLERTFIYWFGDEDGVTIANYPAFLIADTWRKFFGRTTNWSLYVVWSDTKESSAVDFLSSLPVIQPKPL